MKHLLPIANVQLNPTARGTRFRSRLLNRLPFMKLRPILWLSALLFAGAVQAQPGPLVDCQCLASLHELQITACQATIPDLCALAGPCVLGPVFPQCSQTPPPGGSVGPGTHPITVTFTDFSTGLALTQTCNVNFVVTVPPGGCGTNNCIRPPTGMVGWWPLDEGCGATVYADLSGSGNPAIVESGGPVCNPGSPNAVPGKVAGGGFFYGPTVRGRASSPSLNFGTGSFSADCWVDPVQFAGGRQPIVDKLDQPSTSSTFGYALSILNGNVELRVGDSSLYTYTSVNSVNFSAWNFVAVAVDRTVGTVTFHVNGVSEPAQPLAPALSFNSTVDLLLGGSHAVNDPYGELALDEVELFNRVLTTNEMTALWQADSNGKCKTNQPCPVTISCPTNMTVHTCGTNAVVPYPLPTLSGPCASNATVVCTPPPNSTFPAGTTTVACTVFDGNGLEAGKCSFTVTVVPFSSGVYDFLPVTIPGVGGKFTSPNGNGFITAQTAGGPFLGLNNTMYPSQFTNLFPASGVVQGYLAQGDDSAFYTVTFDLQNYALSPSTVFGIWNITEETGSYKVEVFSCAPALIAPPFTSYFDFMGYDDNALDGNIGWFHMTLNPASGFLSTSQFKAAGIDCDAVFWTNLPPNACKIVVTGRLGPQDGVVFYFAEPKPCCEITCPTNLTVSTCAPSAVVNYPTPTLSGSCGTDMVIVCTPPSGSAFPLGTTTVTCAAFGPQGSQVACSFTVTVVSGELPVITCPSNIVVTGFTWCDSHGVTVGYPLPQVSNGTLVSCTPPSGSLFPWGTTTVTCVTTNACGTNRCTFTVTVNSGGWQGPCTPPPANMVMWLKFDETNGPTALNASAGNQGTLYNGPTRNPGQYVVNSLCFDGANDYVQVQPYAAMQFGTNDFSVDAWVKPATLDNTVRIIVDHREENGGVIRGYSLFLGGNNTLAFQIADGTHINYPSTLVVPADGQWHFVAVTVKRNDPQGIRFYVDGVQGVPGRDPTGHMGSVTAGPCYPFRVGSRSSSVSGLFKGCIDEVELFRRALTAAELQAIYDARCKGKCRISCQLMNSQILSCWVGGFTNTLIFYNPLPVPQAHNWVVQPLPIGPGCPVPGPSFSPASGTVTVPAYGAALANTVVTFPGGLNAGQCSCFRMVITSADGSQRAECDGKFCLPRGPSVCCQPSTPLIAITNLEPATVSFTLTSTNSAPTQVAHARLVLLSPENVPLAITPLGPLTIPPAGGVLEVPQTYVFPDYDPGRIYRVALEADAEGSGEFESLASLALINVLPDTGTSDELNIQRGIGGKIIIKWPYPCGFLEVNPNLADPAGWTPVTGQTSPWTFTPTPDTGAGFIRLVK